MKRHSLTIGEFLALAIAAAVGVLVYVALGAVGFAFPVALVAAWLAMVPVEYSLSGADRAVPEVDQSDAALDAVFPLRELFGPLSIGFPALALAFLVAWAVPIFLDTLVGRPLPVLDTVLAYISAPVTFMAVLFGMSAVGQRTVQMRLDAKTRKLTIDRPRGQRVELHISEIASIRHQDGTLFVEHAMGVEEVWLGQVEWDQLEWVAREMDAYATELGADRQARQNRLKAQQALSRARRPEG